MEITVVIPAYKTPKMLAYTVSQLLKHTIAGLIKIVIVNNFPKDTESKRYLSPFEGNITFVDYPDDKLQSHGIAIDWAIQNGLVDTDYFLMLESDAFPTKDGWINYYYKFIEQDFDAAGSVLELSGGCYLHPCGCLYKTSTWYEAQKYVNSLDFHYFPNMAYKEGFQCHLMVQDSIINDFLKCPDDYVELTEGYKPYTQDLALERLKQYLPVAKSVFHNGMGGLSESVNTYGKRTFDIDVPFILLGKNSKKLIHRIGYEPGQFYSYWMDATDKKYANIPTEIKWMNDRVGQQQEYTLNEAGIKHIWGVSSYTERSESGVEDIYESKRRLPNELYNTLPESQKVPE